MRPTYSECTLSVMYILTVIVPLLQNYTYMYCAVTHCRRYDGKSWEYRSPEADDIS